MSVRKENVQGAEGSIRERLRVDVDVEMPDGRRVRVKKVLPMMSMKRARQYESDLRDSILDGTYGREEVVVPTLEAFAVDYLRDFAKARNKPSSYEAKETILKRHLLPAFGARKLDQIDQRAIDAFKAAQLARAPKPMKPKTLNNVLTVLHNILAIAVRWKLLQVVPAFEWVKAPKPSFDFLDFAEAEQLVANAEPEWRPIIVVALRTGLRQGELRALRRQDVDLKRGRIVVRQSVWRGKFGTPKSGREREIPLSADAREALRKSMHLRGELVFCDAEGKLETKDHLKYPLWRACRAAGLREIGWHVLRHTFASHLVMRGVPLKTVQELLGHATIEMTMRYAHLSPSVKSDAVALLDGPAPVVGHLTATDAQGTQKTRT